MAKINLPQETLQKESFKTLPAKKKDEYVSNLLKKILELNPEGITITQIKEAAGLTYSTIWHHLEVLSCTAQCHKVSHGNLDVYFPNVNVTHLNDYNKGKVRYSISTIENSEGYFVSIHESRENRSGNYSVCKGAYLPVDLIDDFVNELIKTKKHLNAKK